MTVTQMPTTDENENGKTVDGNADDSEKTVVSSSDNIKLLVISDKPGVIREGDEIVSQHSSLYVLSFENSELANEAFEYYKTNADYAQFDLLYLQMKGTIQPASMVLVKTLKLSSSILIQSNLLII